MPTVMLTVAGHAGNLQKDVHFDSTCASTPSQNLTRLLMTIMVQFKMKKLVFDISMSHCNAELPESHKIAIRYPNGLQRFKTIDGLGMLLNQAVPAFKMWYDKEVTVTEELRNKVIEHLGRN